MAAEIRTLRTQRKRLRADRAAELRQLVIDFQGLDSEAVERIVVAIDRETAAELEWTFVMLSPVQNALVVRQIMQRATRPNLTAQLWANLFTRLRLDTGEIIATRQELAAELATHPSHVSAALRELEAMGALIRQRDGRRSRWFMNPKVGTHLSGAARDKAQAAAPDLKLVS
jgi:hypothetical protein